MSEREKVISAIRGAIALNEGARASSSSLTAVLEVVSQEQGKAPFERLCKDLLACIHKCFSHFSKVLASFD